MAGCASCGAENPAGQKFCSQCGSPLAVVCPSCGSSRRPDEKFCGECGTSLNATAPPALAGMPDSAAPAAERRLVSVLFADLVGFTPLSESRDPEEVRELLSRYFDTCRRLIEVYGGAVEKFIGDAVMAVWGTPTATEDDAERAVRAGLDLVAAVSALGDEVGAPQLSARAGVLTGEAAVTLGAEGQGMVAGDLVNTAARIQAEAEPGAVLVGETTRRAAEGAIAFGPAGEHTLKGKAEPVPLWRAVRVTAARGGALRSEGLEAPFVGRDLELRQVKELFHACAEERRPRLVSVIGIAGIGKSRLGWEFYKYFDGIAGRVLWHRGRCLAYGEGVAYWALADMVRMRCRIAEDEPVASAREKLSAALVEYLLDADERTFVKPRLAQLLGLGTSDAGDRAQLFAAWRIFFERLAESDPVVLLFEDLQWADASLLDFVEHVLEWSRSHPIFIVTLARPELLERRPTWGAGQRQFTSITLEPLSDAAMRELLDGLVPGLPEHLQEQILSRAEGVPLYAVETVRMLLDRGALVQEGSAYRVATEVEALDVPETLHSLIAARLDGLPIEERRMLQEASVLGKTFSRDTLVAVTSAGGDVDPLLASLVRKEVLGVQTDPRLPEHGQYGFLQDLVRHVAYETLSRAQRKALHLAAADGLAGSFDENEIAEVIAAHLLAAYETAGDDDLKLRARDALARAGERAEALAAAAEARRYFEQAASLTDELPARARLTFRAGHMAWLEGDLATARRLLTEAHDLHLRADERREAALVSARLADVDWHEGQVHEAVARLGPVLAELDAHGPGPELAEVLAALARFEALSGDLAGGLEHVERALSLAEALFVPATLASALLTRAMVIASSDRNYESRVLLQGALELALAHDVFDSAVRAYNNLADALEREDRYGEVVSVCERRLELVRRLGSRFGEAGALAARTPSLVLSGRWDDALASAEEVMALSEAVWVRGVLVPVVAVHCERGDPALGRELFERICSVGRSEDPQSTVTYAAGEAMLLRGEGRTAEALACAEDAVGELERVGSTFLSVKLALVEALEAVSSLGEEERVGRLVGTIEALQSGRRSPFLDATAARFRGRLGGPDATEAFERAELLFGELRVPFYLAATQLEHAEWLAEQGRAGEAQPLLAQARETFEQLGATPWLERLKVQTQARPGVPA